jgi:signal transduction histidine kinase
VERAPQGSLSIPDDNLADLSASWDVFSAEAGSTLRELCHDLIEPAATIRWLVRAASEESGQELRNRLEAIAVAAGQIAAICEYVFDRPQHCAGTRLDLLAEDAVASAQVRYAGVIDVASEPVTVLAHPGDLVRIMGNVLTNACRAAGPVGRVRVVVDQAEAQARLAITDSGHGLGHTVPDGRPGLGLEIVGALTLKYGGSVHLGVGDLGGLAVTVCLPVPGGSAD